MLRVKYISRYYYKTKKYWEIFYLFICCIFFNPLVQQTKLFHVKCGLYVVRWNHGKITNNIKKLHLKKGRKNIKETGFAVGWFLMETESLPSTERL